MTFTLEKRFHEKRILADAVRRLTAHQILGDALAGRSPAGGASAGSDGVLRLAADGKNAAVASFGLGVSVRLSVTRSLESESAWTAGSGRVLA